MRGPGETGYAWGPHAMRGIGPAGSVNRTAMVPRGGVDGEDVLLRLPLLGHGQHNLSRSYRDYGLRDVGFSEWGSAAEGSALFEGGCVTRFLRFTASPCSAPTLPPCPAGAPEPNRTPFHVHVTFTMRSGGEGSLLFGPLLLHAPPSPVSIAPHTTQRLPGRSPTS